MAQSGEEDPVKALWLFAASHLDTDDMSAFGRLLDMFPAKQKSLAKGLRGCIATRFTNAGKEYYGVDAEKFREILAQMEKKE